jgi:hypothetical protein
MKNETIIVVLFQRLDKAHINEESTIEFQVFGWLDYENAVINILPG